MVELIEVTHAWAGRDHDGELRIVLGSEPFVTERTSFGTRATMVTDEARTWCLERGISLLDSAKLLETINLIDTGSVQQRAVAGPNETTVLLWGVETSRRR